MNLREFSERVGVSPEKISRSLLEKKNTRIISQTMQLSDTILSYLWELYGQEGVLDGNVYPSPPPVRAKEGGGTKTTNVEEIGDVAAPLVVAKEERGAEDTDAKTPPRESESLENLITTLFPGRALLEKCIREKYHILVDTSSILRKPNAFEMFFQTCKPILLRYGSCLEVPYPVVAELARKAAIESVDTDALQLRTLAEKGLNLLKVGHTDGVVRFLGDREETHRGPGGDESYFADASFLIRILSWRNNSESLLLITNDYALASDVVNKIAGLSSVRSTAEVLVRKLDSSGMLVDALDAQEESYTGVDGKIEEETTADEGTIAEETTADEKNRGESQDDGDSAVNREVQPCEREGGNGHMQGMRNETASPTL